jgi:protein TonB
MVRTLPHPSSPTPFARIDAKRVAGNTLAVAVHAVVFGLLLLPSSWSPPDAARRSEPTVVLYEPVDARPIPPTQPPPLQPVRPEPRPVSTPVRITPTPAPAVADAPVFEQGEIFSPPASDTGPVETTFEPGPPEMATLAYDVAPAPRYPRNALRSGREGTVLLRVLVDDAGRPQEVVVETSSGHRDLDRAALQQVLERWRFHPAQRNGRAVAAYALVPVEFRVP